MTRSFAQTLPVGRGRIVERRQRGLILGEHAGRVVVTLERATVPLEHASLAARGSSGGSCEHEACQAGLWCIRNVCAAAPG